MSTSKRREREKEERKTAIISVAEQVFFEKGFESATMDEIAEGAELAKGTLYLYFESKDALYHAVVLKGMQILIAMFREGVKKKRKGINKIMVIGETYARFAHQYPQHAVIMSYSKSSDISKGTNEIHEALQMKDEEIFEIIAGALQAGIQDGSIRKDTDVEKTTFLIALLTQYYMSVLTKNEKAIEHAVSMSIDTATKAYFDFIKKALES